MKLLPLLVALAACDGDFADPSRELGPAVEEGADHPVVVVLPKTLGVVDTPLVDVNGTPIGVACATCHGPDAETSWVGADGVTTDDPRDFHTKVELEHGDLTCNACHDADRTRLHLADGQQLELAETMTLCSQCHGQQRTSFDHGAHGGMNGHWDLKQGPRTRNHCVTCHAPHAPAYEAVRPVHPPRDRFLRPAGGTPAATGAH